MKLPVKVVLLIGGVLYTLLILMAITSSAVRANEAEQALAAAVEQSFKYLMTESGYAIENYDELIADFNQNLLLKINSDSDLKVEVLTASLSKGVLDIRVTESYKTVRGNKKEAICRKTVLLEQYQEKKQYFTVTYLVDDRVYDKYSMFSGGELIIPVQPQKEGRSFRHWSLEGSLEPVDLATIKLTKDLIFTAVFE